ncbi:hypothetical protein SSBG_00971 [Streptomyces sp. SPB074]|nr:hypothetical protein SSBG_00971 [Streptomyces sp. SPB074]
MTGVRFDDERVEAVWPVRAGDDRCPKTHMEPSGRLARTRRG